LAADSAVWLLLIIDIRQLLAAAVFHDKAPRAAKGRMVAARIGESEKVHNGLDQFEHLLLRFIAFGHVCRQSV
jgi:hypothetical protein